MQKFKNIYILCPPQTESGGPEASHQLVGEMCKLDISAKLIYYKKKRTILNLKGKLDISVKGNVIHTANYLNPTPKSYDCYGALISNKIIDDEKSLLILPENLLHLVDFGKKIKKAIWWLSIDNALMAISKLQNISVLRSEIIHFYQSEYARQFLELLNFENSFPLSDYISEKIISSQGEEIPREKIVVYNPKKGFEFTKQLIHLFPEINFLPLINMSKDEVCTTLKKASVYIDFGEHPGKDRIPREAALLGCCVITSKNGSAKFSKDVHIPDEFKFKKNSDNLKPIGRAIYECIENYSVQNAKFDAYRYKIEKEKKVFIEEIKSKFL